VLTVLNVVSNPKWYERGEGEVRVLGGDREVKSHYNWRSLRQEMRTSFKIITNNNRCTIRLFGTPCCKRVGKFIDTRCHNTLTNAAQTNLWQGSQNSTKGDIPQPPKLRVWYSSHVPSGHEKNSPSMTQTPRAEYDPVISIATINK
jgi:hypothetical protein